jgi:hypothetical protein
MSPVGAPRFVSKRFIEEKTETDEFIKVKSS